LQGLSPYEKKKYVWKMLYIYMLGYDVDFGHTETVSLISAPKYPEKQVKPAVSVSLPITFFLQMLYSNLV
jgi:AP-2 complex subunit alpha